MSKVNKTCKRNITKLIIDLKDINIKNIRLSPFYQTRMNMQSQAQKTERFISMMF